MLFAAGYAGGRLPPGVEVVGRPFALDELARRAQALLAAAREGRAEGVDRSRQASGGPPRATSDTGRA